ncbi:MAG TPA: class I SAM-dependent methyltransferase [Nitrospira sp.]|nr:class I SAM-dependent methyltransferase [Nitrospira sp.]
MSGAHDHLDDIAPLEADGERFLPEMQGTIALEHLHRYAVARDLARGKTVLDIACGEGYGSSMLADIAAHVVGVDISVDAVAHASAKYRKPNLEFRVGDCTNIPLDRASVDMIVSFETIEHHAEHEKMLAEIKRVLRPDGLMVMSSPDKREYTEQPVHENAFHVKELYAHEFEALLRRHFTNCAFLGQRVLYASMISFEGPSADQRHHYRAGSSDLQSVSGLFRPVYWVAVASDGTLPPLSTGLLEQFGESDPAIKQLQYQCDQFRGRIAGLQEEVAGLHRAIHLILNSRSWKITRPLRAAGTFLKCFREPRMADDKRDEHQR